MSMFQKWTKKAADSIKTAVKTSTKEEAQERLNIMTSVVTMGGIILIVFSALKSHPDIPYTPPAQPLSHSLQPMGGTLINIYLSDKGGA